ncbi:uncharacterized protein LOC117522192 [Thalassophryne amazonica]|uniref:uncharacterized protein LOC117522192 n=1 Tax=Thalassophryne amazonica TaxID=390379 RepID=UPI00147087CB|nr:uncharacterized protein LOC117522192 [Thalassophryne amazonica]XP_034039487.1 uncharacterized protein LOC117522192 [Thalassophryne amazonica]
MPFKIRKSKLRPMPASSPAPRTLTEELETVPGPAVPDEEDAGPSSDSQAAPLQEQTKRKSPTAGEGERLYPWREGHQETMAAFWRNNPLFYDKGQQHYKNTAKKRQLMQELIERNRMEWEEIHRPVPTVPGVRTALDPTDDDDDDDEDEMEEEKRMKMMMKSRFCRGHSRRVSSHPPPTPSPRGRARTGGWLHCQQPLQKTRRMCLRLRYCTRPGTSWVAS